MQIKEITMFEVEGERFSTLQEAKDHMQREELIRVITSESEVDRYVAVDIIDALHRRYNLVPKE